MQVQELNITCRKKRLHSALGKMVRIPAFKFYKYLHFIALYVCTGEQHLSINLSSMLFVFKDNFYCDLRAMLKKGPKK